MDSSFYLRLLLASLVILAVWNALGKGQIFDALGEKMEDWPPWLGKPFGLCPPCMSSVYGSAVWFLTGGDWIWWTPFVLALSGALVLISRNLLKNG